MTNRELQTKYNLTKEDFWEVRGGNWVLSHSACEKIASIEGIVFSKPEVHLTNFGLGLVGEAYKQGKEINTIWATGEAGPENVKMSGKYYWAMAEKRLKDRLTIKLIDAFGIYSEEEAEEFKNNN